MSQATGKIYLEPAWEVSDASKPKTRVLNMLPANATELAFQLEKLTELLANTIDTNSAVLFLVTEDERLEVFTSKSMTGKLSKEASSSSLISWTATSKSRISIAQLDPEQHVLGYYEDENPQISSFCSVPIIGMNGKVAGVISIDHKKPYAFTKTGENLLEAAAHQASFLLHLHENKPVNSVQTPFYEERLETAGTVDTLFKVAADVPQTVIPHESSVLVATGGVVIQGESRLYGFDEECAQSNHLLQLICTDLMRSVRRVIICCS